jgi:hypothetical protein
MKQVSNKQLQEWKDKYGGGSILEVEDKGCYLKPPTMLDWKRAMSLLQEVGENAMALSLLNSCWLGGDDVIKTDDSYFLPAKKKLVKLFEYPDAKVEKDGDTYTIEIEGKVCKVKPVTREELDWAENKNPSNKPFVTDEKLFDSIKVEADEAFSDKNNATYRFPLYKALEELQNQKRATLKKF